MLVSNFGMHSHRLVDGNDCFGRTNNVRGLQWRPDRNVRKTTWQREKGMNFKRPPFESERQSAGWTNKTCKTLTVETVSHAPPCDVTTPPPLHKEKEDSERWRGEVFTVACLLTQGVITATLAEPKGNCWHRQQHIQLQFTPMRAVCNVVWRQVHPDHERGMSDRWRKGEVRDRGNKQWDGYSGGRWP